MDGTTMKQPAAKFQVPPTKEAVIDDIGVKSALLTATGWELAAELAAIVRFSGSGNVKSDIYLSTTDVARFGIRGLTSHNTVERYVKAWLKESGGLHPEPGDLVVLPLCDFPPDAKNVGSRTTTSNIGQQLNDDPELATAAAKALAEGAIKSVDPDTNRELWQAARQQITDLFPLPDRFPMPAAMTLDEMAHDVLARASAFFKAAATFMETYEGAAQHVDPSGHATLTYHVCRDQMERRFDRDLRDILVDSERL